MRFQSCCEDVGQYPVIELTSRAEFPLSKVEPRTMREKGEQATRSAIKPWQASIDVVQLETLPPFGLLVYASSGGEKLILKTSNSYQCPIIVGDAPQASSRTCLASPKVAGDRELHEHGHHGTSVHDQ